MFLSSFLLYFVSPGTLLYYICESQRKKYEYMKQGLKVKKSLMSEQMPFEHSDLGLLFRQHLHKLSNGPYQFVPCLPPKYSNKSTSYCSYPKLELVHLSNNASAVQIVDPVDKQLTKIRLVEWSLSCLLRHIMTVKIFRLNTDFFCPPVSSELVDQSTHCVNLYHSVEKCSLRHFEIFFLMYSRKQALTFHADVFQRKQCA